MKASLPFAFLGVAAVAFTTASARNIDVSDHKNVETAENANAVQPLYLCQMGGDASCDWICKFNGDKGGKCNSKGGCKCQK